MSVIGDFHGSYVHNRRVRVLTAQLAPLLPPKATLLDVGCGDGLLASLLKQARPDIDVTGIDVLARDHHHIPVQPFDGSTIPFEKNRFDAIMMVDVLHHTEDPMTLLGESARVAREAVLIKDHLMEGLLAAQTLRFMDYIGNAKHKVVLPYNYWKKAQWQHGLSTCHLTIDHWDSKLGLYPFPANLFFERSLHFIAKLSPPA